MPKSRVERLVDEVDKLRRKKKLSVAEFAREIGFITRGGYTNVYRWLIERKGALPGNEVVLKLVEWRDKQKRKTNANES